MPPDERRAAIIAAVVPLLHEHGEAVTCRQIAEAAGIAEGTIFRVFADKDELLLAAFDREVDLAPLEAAIRSIDSALAFEQRLIEATELVQRRVSTSGSSSPSSGRSCTTAPSARSPTPSR